MRITNGIMINNNLSNINKNKVSLDKVMTQIETTKKIQRPSEDPIIAVRALRLRSTYNAIEQYKDRNVEDADSWMTTTAEALGGINDVLENIVYYCNQGVNEYQTVEEYEAIISSLKSFKEAVYEDGNADYGDRTIFTGYKTDSTLTFEQNDATVSYNITENHSFDDIDTFKRLVGVSEEDINEYETTYENSSTGLPYTGANITNEAIHVMRLGYDDIDNSAVSVVIDPKGTATTYTAEIISSAQLGEQTYANIDPDKVYLVRETGELVFGNNVYNMANSKDFTVNYTKTGFDKGELKPEHYFDCVKTEQAGTDENGTPKTKVTQYTAKDQKIEYTVRFNQPITANVQGKDELTHDIGRDIDEMIDRIRDMQETTSKLNKVKEKIALTTDKTELSRLNSLKVVLEVEQKYAQDNVTDVFSQGIEKFKEHQQNVTVVNSDLAARMKRLSMIQDRLEQQALTVEELKSKNEDTNLTAAAVEYKAMNNVYTASLSVSAKVIQQTLLDFL